MTKVKKDPPIHVRPLVRLHIVNLLLGGIVLSLLLFGLAVAVLVNEGLTTRRLWVPSAAKATFSKYNVISSDLSSDLYTRLNNLENSSSESSDSSSWEDALASLRPSLPSTLLPLLDARVTAFTSATTKGLILSTYVDLVMTLAGAVFLALGSQNPLTSLSTAPAIVLSSAQGAFGSLFSRMAYLSSKSPSQPVLTEDVVGLMLQYGTSLHAPLFGIEAMTLASNYANEVKEAEAMIQAVFEFQNVSSTIDGDHLSTLTSAIDILTTATQKKKNVSSDTVALALDLVAAIASLAALILCLLNVHRYFKNTYKTRQVVNVFEDAKSRKMFQQQYLPVITGLQAVRHPELRTNELTRMFSIAACFADVLRTITPQLLFGHGKKSSKEWSLLEERVNLSAGKPRYYPHVVAVEVTLEPHFREEISFYERNLAEQMEMLNEVFRIVVGETNKAGGLVAGVRGNLSILTLWNTLWTAKNVELIALRTAFRIQHRLTRVCACPRVLIGIASGPAVLGKIESGNRKYASALGSVFAFLDAVRSTGEAIGCNIVIDRPTNRRLPRSVAHLLKPLVVLRVQLPTGTSSCVMYTVDQLDSQVSETQRSMYMKCFSLYQNNLYNEATIAYERYLYQYPDDRVARWVYEVVVRPQYELRTLSNPSSGNVLKYSSGEIPEMGL